MTESSSRLRIIEETPAYWRVVFDNPPLNIMDADMFEGLQDLLGRMDTSPSLRVVVFESANPDFHLAHFDLAHHAADYIEGFSLFAARWLRCDRRVADDLLLRLRSDRRLQRFGRVLAALIQTTANDSYWWISYPPWPAGPPSPSGAA